MKFQIILTILTLINLSASNLSHLIQNKIFYSVPILNEIASLLLPWERPIKTNDIRNIRETYDFIIVGSGSAGSVLANRLSENPEWNVLLLEVGIAESIYAMVPAAASTLQATRYNYKYSTEPEENACEAMEGRRCAWPRGKALGGSTVINHMIYTRGNREDYRRWVNEGNPGWSYEEVLPYYLKSEDVHLNSYDKFYHNKGGYLSTETPFNSPLARTFVDAGKSLGHKEIDYNGENFLGFSIVQANQKRGRRHSVATAFLKPILKRQNLHVLTNSKVTKILINAETKTAFGVRFEHFRKTYEIKTSKEVILSAGAFHSPQLLMLSGIGPKKHLEELNIPLIQNLPVGQMLYDHIAYVGLVFTINQTVERFSDLFRPSTILSGYLNGKGFLSSLSGVEALAFIKTNISKENYPDVELIFSGIGSLTSDRGTIVSKSLRIRQEFYDKTFKPIQHKPSWTAFPVLLHPKSYGYMRLKSKNPYDAPLFYGNYLKHEQDVNTLIEGIKYVIKLSNTEPFQRFESKLSPVPVAGCENELHDSDDYWRCAIKKLTTSIHHQISTCKMGRKSDKTAVVDNKLSVHGVHNLRVCDTSVIPVSLSAHTNAPTIMLGEKASDLIKESWGYI